MVLSKGETQRLFDGLSKAEAKSSSAPKTRARNRYELAARLRYGTGLRRSELVRLRIKDIDLDRRTVTVHQGKGDKACRSLRLRPAVCIVAPPRL